MVRQRPDFYNDACQENEKNTALREEVQIERKVCSFSLVDETVSFQARKDKKALLAWDKKEGVSNYPFMCKASFQADKRKNKT